MVSFLNQKSKTKQRVSLVAVALAIYFVLMPFDLFPLLGTGTILRLVALLPIAIVIVSLRGKYCIYKHNLMITLIIYWLLSFASIFYSISFETSLSQFRTLSLNVLLIIVAAGLYVFNRREIEFLKISFVVGSILSFIMTMIFADYSADDRLTIKVGDAHADQNYINGYIMFAVVYFTEKAVKKRNVLYTIPVAAGIWFSLMTGSRGGMIAVVASIAITFIFAWMKENGLSIRMVIVIVALLVIAYFFVPFLFNMISPDVAERFSLNYISEEGTTGRTDIWKSLLRLFCDSNIGKEMFGNGIGTTSLVNTIKVTGSQQGLAAHNLWIDQLTTGGIVGVISLVVMQIVYFRTALKNKDVFCVGVYTGLLVMCLSLSLTSFKPIWNCMMLIIIVQQCNAYSDSRQNAVT